MHKYFLNVYYIFSHIIYKTFYMHNNDKICFDFTHKYVNTNKIKI